MRERRNRSGNTESENGFRDRDDVDTDDALTASGHSMADFSNKCFDVRVPLRPALHFMNSFEHDVSSSEEALMKRAFYRVS